MTDIKHSEREHSLFSPSGYERWSRCPASALYTADIPREDNEHSLRGTWCHEQVERLFNGEEIETDSPYYDQTTNDHIIFVYEYVRYLIEHCSILEPAEVWHEERIGDDDVFGTCDLRIYDVEHKVLWVVDYKFGYKPVGAKNNGQLRMYAALADTYCEREVETFKLMVIQPTNARNPVDAESLTYDELDKWYQSKLDPALVAAQREGAEFVPGEIQCNWCPASGKCEAQKNKAIEVFDEYESKRPETLPYDTLLPLLSEMEIFIKGVRSQARASALQGEKINGHKLVRSVTRSKWLDKEKAEKWLAARKIPKAQRTKTDVISIGAAKKLVAGLLKDKPILQKNFNSLITKPEGELVLVPDDDPRAEVLAENPLMGDDLI